MFELQKELESKLLLLEYYEKQINKVKEDVDDINNLLEKEYQGYKKLNDIEKEIYIEKYKYKWSAVKIGNKHGYTDRQVRRIIKKINDKINN